MIIGKSSTESSVSRNYLHISPCLLLPLAPSSSSFLLWLMFLSSSFPVLCLRYCSQESLETQEQRWWFRALPGMRHASPQPHALRKKCHTQACTKSIFQSPFIMLCRAGVSSEGNVTSQGLLLHLFHSELDHLLQETQEWWLQGLPLAFYFQGSCCCPQTQDLCFLEGPCFAWLPWTMCLFSAWRWPRLESKLTGEEV